MISFEDAVAIIKSNSGPLDTERIALSDSLGRVLREDVVSDIDMPPFDKSAVDGFACRKEDVRTDLQIIGTIAAGSQVALEIGRNQCARIMTGAVIPKGADCVIMVEEVEPAAERTIRFKGSSVVANICYKGEDVVIGNKLVSAGSRISPKETASLAIAGCANPLVSRKPRVGIVATGDEIVEPSMPLLQSQIRNSNSYQLIAHAKQFGCDVTYFGIARDSDEAIGDIIRKSKSKDDLLLLTGGVSMGDLDLVPSLLEQNGYRTLFHGVSIQPGRPTIFGKSGDTFVFGIAGNPVASFIIFETVIKELLASMMGLRDFHKTVKCTVAKTIKRQKTRRLGWRPVKITPDGKAVTVEYHGTAHITSYADADGILPIPIGISEIPEGTSVDVRLI